jgi:hypothetical protein
VSVESFIAADNEDRCRFVDAGAPLSTMCTTEGEYRAFFEVDGGCPDDLLPCALNGPLCEEHAGVMRATRPSNHCGKCKRKLTLLRVTSDLDA